MNVPGLSCLRPHDPHDDTPQIPAVQQLKDGFWRPDGVVHDVCGGAPCTGPQY